MHFAKTVTYNKYSSRIKPLVPCLSEDANSLTNSNTEIENTVANP